ncbi:phosphatidate cytidylyltransferase [Chloroflexota bacterium]
MLRKRVITSLLGIPIVITVVWYGEPWFTIFMTAWGLLAVFEFYKMVSASKVAPLTYFGLFGTLLFILSPHINNGVTTSLLVTSVIIIPLIWLLLHPQKARSFTVWVWTIAGILYVGWLISYLVILRGVDGGRNWVFIALFATFVSDTSAFFIGRAWGKHLLAPRISPGKTWEGTLAGIIGAIIISLFFKLPTSFSLPLNYSQAIFLGLLISVFGQIGDLIESLFKRNLKAKDSSHFLPGHGGFLDRMDSIVFANIVVYYYMLSFNAGWLNWLA